MKRRLFLASTISSALTACSPIGTKLNDTPGFHNLLGTAQGLNHALIGTHGMAREYKDADVDREFRVNGLATPSDATYSDLARTHFSGYRLVVDGAVERKAAFPLHQLQLMHRATQITRHDCVEGWSAIGKWSGIPLRDVLALVSPTDKARYVVFHCFDVDDQGTRYYESLDLQQAQHPQALLALTLNDRPLDADHGAPVRLRVPTQLGYKSAKWVARLEFVSDLSTVGSGSGGYWEDQGYEWYAGI